MTGSDDRLPAAVYSASQVRDLERLATERHGVSAYDLMCRAGAAALRVLRASWPHARTLVVLCGPGNNGGDGFVLARLAHAEQLLVTALTVGSPDRLKGIARRAFEDCGAAGVVIEAFDAKSIDAASPDVVVDALLGIGIDRALEDNLARAVAAINAARAPVLALDVPSGLHADSGLPLGDAVRASVTVTFLALKQGLYLGAACDYTGRIEVADLGLPNEAADAVSPPLRRLGRSDLERVLPRRPRSSHKGTSGRLLLIGGGAGMPGAIRLAAEAALRSGAGLVYVAAASKSVPVVLAGRAEIIGHEIDRAVDLDALVEIADAAVVGPGLGTSAWARALWRRVLDTKLPLVVDADALNLLARSPSARGRWILTPHPGEAARLLGTTTDAVQRDRAAAARALAARFDAIAVLKGAGTLVASDPAAPLGVCDRGNPGMATGGMGDVLAGVIGSLLVQTRDLEASARAGVLLHSLAGDDAAAAGGERGTLASDLMPHLRRWANPSS